MTPPIPPSIPDPGLFANGARPCFLLDATRDGRRVGLAVIYLDTFEHQVYGAATEIASAFWLSVAVEGKNLVSRAYAAEEKIAAMERGATITVNAEIRSRIAELVLRAERSPGERWFYNARIDGERLLADLGVNESP